MAGCRKGAAGQEPNPDRIPVFLHAKIFDEVRIVQTLSLQVFE